MSLAVHVCWPGQVIKTENSIKNTENVVIEPRGLNEIIHCFCLSAQMFGIRLLVGLTLCC